MKTLKSAGTQKGTEVKTDWVCVWTQDRRGTEEANELIVSGAEPTVGELSLFTPT